jgi:high-affinity iron transporter
MGNALFIVWRESAEAMLVVGILHAWLRQRPDAATGMRYLWGGVAAGAALAIALALVMLGIASSLSGNGLDYFQLAMLLLASGLIVQMVFWMRRHGRTFRKDLESSMARSARAANWWGLLVVVALAVGRETAETVVFLYGIGAGKGGIADLPVVLVLGIAAAFGTFWLLQQGSRVLSWRHFFRVSEILLLLLAGALLVSGVEKLIALDVLPALVDPVWNTSRVLDDSGRLGGLIASFTGYRSRPALLPLLVLFAYWVIMATLLARAGRSTPAAANAAHTNKAHADAAHTNKAHANAPRVNAPRASKPLSRAERR